MIRPAPLPLATRTGLPDALRVLLADYPRGGWQADPNFAGLVEFWLSRHLMFRRMMELLRRDSETFSDASSDPRRYAATLSRIGGRFVTELHGHHGIEDQHYFPRLARIEPRLQAGFDLLDADHHALDGHLSDFVTGANDLIGLADTEPLMRGAAGAFAEQMAGLERFLDRHLVDEEELVVPVILRHGAETLG